MITEQSSNFNPDILVNRADAVHRLSTGDKVTLPVEKAVDMLLESMQLYIEREKQMLEEQKRPEEVTQDNWQDVEVQGNA